MQLEDVDTKLCGAATQPKKSYAENHVNTLYIINQGRKELQTDDDTYITVILLLPVIKLN